MILRACLRCGVPTKDGYCPEHPKPKPWANSQRRERMGISGGRWETIRKRVLERDQGVCFLCDQSGADEVDHLLGPEHNELTALASVHKQCHRHRHANPEQWTERVEWVKGVLGSEGKPAPPTVRG